MWRATRSSSSTESRRCTALEYNDGAWHRDAEMQAPYRLTRDPATNNLVLGWVYSTHGYWGMCDDGLPADYTRQVVQLKWKPRRCSLLPVSASTFCKRFWRDLPHPGRISTKAPSPMRELLIVGDSLTSQVYISLLALLRGRIVANTGDSQRTGSTTRAWAYRDIPSDVLVSEGLVCLEHNMSQDVTQSKAALERESARDAIAYGRPPVKISFVRNEYLEVSMRKPVSHYNGMYPWSGRLTPKTILITQVTAWFYNSGEHLTQQLSSVFEAAKQNIGARWREQVIVLSASIGHRWCEIETRHGMVRPSDRPKPGQHNYTLLNGVAANLAAEAGVTYIDVSTMLNLRADGHNAHDCGHWCLPGPYDITTQLIHNALLGHIDFPVAHAMPL